MGLYSRTIAPWLADRACMRSEIADERAKLIPRAAGVVVEIGIGTGLNLAFYQAARVRVVYGVDPGEGFLARGARRFAASAVPVEILHAAAEAIPLADGIADTVVATYTLCSVTDPLQALREVRRILKPEGSFLFLEHGRSHHSGVARWQDRLNGAWRPVSCGCNLNRDVPALLVGAGLRIVELARFDLPDAPSLFAAHVRGVARLN